MRKDGRKAEQLRSAQIVRGFTTAPFGSALVEAGRTRVLCTVSMEDGVPPFLLNTNKGWLTAEYSMLPGCSPQRKSREGRKSGSVDSRALEIGRLIGRSLRSVCDLTRFPGKTVWIDCDVLEADGGTRTWSINGAMVALTDAFHKATKLGFVRGWPLRSQLAAVSVGIVRGNVLTDLAYDEDSQAEVDLNVVKTEQGRYVELQGSAERDTFSPEQLQAMLGAADSAVQEIFTLQKTAAESAPRA